MEVMQILRFSYIFSPHTTIGWRGWGLGALPTSSVVWCLLVSLGCQLLRAFWEGMTSPDDKSDLSAARTPLAWVPAKDTVPFLRQPRDTRMLRPVMFNSEW
jgi:hypothetical protein